MLEFLAGAYWPATILFVPLLAACVISFFYFLDKTGGNDPKRTRMSAFIGSFSMTVLFTVWSAPEPQRSVEARQNMTVSEIYNDCLPSQAAGITVDDRKGCITVARDLSALQAQEKLIAQPKVPALPSK